MEIVNLVRRDRRSLKQGQSYMSEGSGLCRPPRPIFSLHHAIVGCGAAKGDSIPGIVGAHPCERAAARHSPLEVIDVRRLEVRTGGLIVTAILIQPGDWVRIGPAIRRPGPITHLKSATSGLKRQDASGKRRSSHKASSCE